MFCFSSARKSTHDVSSWSAILMKQHTQLQQEITIIEDFLSLPSFSPLLLDAKVKRLIKGVKLHLDLESTFLNPALEQTTISAHNKQKLGDGYLALQNLCDQTLSLVKSLTLFPNNRQLHTEHLPQVKRLLKTIQARLEEEDSTFSQLHSVCDHV